MTEQVVPASSAVANLNMLSQCVLWVEVNMRDGGYDDGYSSTPCLWGTEPGSLVAEYLGSNPDQTGRVVYDLGCGEGKNSAAFAVSGASVTAIDCSALAIANGQAAWPDLAINWRLENVEKALEEVPPSIADVVVCYGLFHCLEGEAEITRLIGHAKRITAPKGIHIVVAFNDGDHDLSAHPGFSPTLLAHQKYLQLYNDWELLSATDSLLHETHPHNNIPHFHSLTRMVVRNG